jgi:hypothetical protein
MSIFKRFGAGMAACALITTSLQTAAVAAPAVEKPGSLHVQCDGSPDNVSSGEMAARLLGAVTLLALFAPPMENADPSKRKFGADGVAVCSTLIEGEKKEGNATRRVQLTLARALHQIEAKKYEAALADVALARRDAEASGLLADPYYARSQGRAFDLIEGAALFRLGRASDAEEATLRSITGPRAPTWALLATSDYDFALPTASESELKVKRRLTQIFPAAASAEANRLEELGRFAEAAARREALADYDAFLTSDAMDSTLIARAAVSLALSGERDKAAARAKQARANFDKRKADGKPESDGSAFVELMDFYAILETARAGDMKAARRLFAGRSEWLSVSFGAVLETNRLLRAGAAQDELVGALAHTPEQLWKGREDAARAALLAKDADNKTLFALIPPIAGARAYEAVSPNVWRTTKSRMILATKPKDPSKVRGEYLVLFYQGANLAFDSYLMHAALLAKSRGQKGFVFRPVVQGNILAANIVTGNAGDPGLPETLFNDADEVIAAFSPIIPSPEDLKARHSPKQS